MSGEIIRQGDPTSHGGTVLEGSLTDICMGKPISYLGHKVYCPLCKGSFPIIEGILTSTFYGKGVAVAGMKTACGATLIATQFTDMIEWSRGASQGAPNQIKSQTNSQINSPKNSNLSAKTAVAEQAAPTTKAYDQHFLLQDEHTGAVLQNRLYKLHYSGGTIEGRTDAQGLTQKVSADTSETVKIEIFLEGL